MRRSIAVNKDTAALPRRVPGRRHRLVVAVVAASLAVGADNCRAYAYGAGTCNAVADGSFMTNERTHHPGDDGGFALRFSSPDYLAGETLGVTLEHEGSEVYIGFLLYAETAGFERRGLFTRIPGTTFADSLPAPCHLVGHTITHLLGPNNQQPRTRLALAWTASVLPAEALIFRALVLRADPITWRGTDFYEVSATLPPSAEGIFRSRFETLP